jgi:ribosomal protein S3AE
MAEAKRKRKFIDVEIPIIKKTTQLYGYDLEDLKSRIISYDLTRILKGKNVILKLKVEIDKDKATSIPIESKVLLSYIRRIIRKGTNYVEDSFSAECKDSVLRVKPFLITRRKVSRAVRKALRNKARDWIIEYVKNKNSGDVFDSVLKGELQKSLNLVLKKIYPLSMCEIRILKIEKAKL